MFTLPCGVDIAGSVVAGLRHRLRDAPPEAMARVELIANSDRMAGRLRRAFEAGPSTFHPRIRLVTTCTDPRDLPRLAAPVPVLRRRLEIMQLVGALLDAQPDLAPRAARYDLADQLVRLHAEMVDEGVTAQAFETLDTSDQSGHWARSLHFLRIVWPFLSPGHDAPDPQTYLRRAIEARIARWRVAPPEHPVIVAGSTGSRGTTRLLMEAVARLPQGAVILPGVDPHMPADVWGELHDAMTGEDHPQFRFARLCGALGLEPAELPGWTDTPPPDVNRNRVVSLALRPAPVTDQWRRDGPGLPDLPQAMQNVTLVEASGLREEALTIAWRLRAAVEAGETAALVTPDRLLARRVAAALDRWGLEPNDSAGLGLHLTAPGRLMRQVGELMHRPLTAEALIALLKHPLTHSGSDRGQHLLWTRELELHIRETGIPFPDAGKLATWAQKRKDSDAALRWTQWIFDALPRADTASVALPDALQQHLHASERFVAGSGAGTPDALWQKEEGVALRRVVGALTPEAERAGTLSPHDYAALFTALLRGEEVRERVTPHPRIFIWGTIEVRAMGVDLLILAGLNEGTWPAAPPADPWLNRALRHQAGLLLPDRQIGLSAHDFQQAIAAPQVWLTRALRTDDAEAVPARWVNRILNLLQGLPDQNGPDALAQMRARGQRWLDEAALLERPVLAEPAPRPAPAPPVPARPVKLSVTEIRTLIRDPFAIYARHVLRLRPLMPLQRAPDYMLRGTVVHSVMERFVRNAVADPDALRADSLSALAREVLATEVAWPAIRPLWHARLMRPATRFVQAELKRQSRATPRHFEVKGGIDLPEIGFTLNCKADRIDVSVLGRAVIYDYKTGAPPSKSAQTHFDKQLLLEALILEEGGFEAARGPGAIPVDAAVYLGLGPLAPEVAAPIEESPAAQTRLDLLRLIGAYQDPRRGYPARNAVFSTQEVSDYDHLSRFGEWDASQSPQRVVLR